MSPLSSPPPAAASHGPTSRPSDWLLRWPQAWARPGATALDLACGSGRHVRLLAEAGMRVTGVDRDAPALAGLKGVPSVELIEVDIEDGPWPLEGRQFDLVLVTNYLWRPLLDRVKNAVAPGGWLIYETFTDGQQTIGRPARPSFLLRPGELLTVCTGLRVVGFEDGFLQGQAPAQGTVEGNTPPVNGRYVQRVAAVRETGTEAGAYPRYQLQQG
ncbi:Methyltransferase domain-containing protein [Roseateles sp. YR242]|uniref:class I SAM-dependent methyltransferase n=1 Tax=Roseateles sp. YR242 TaxID=1855305 RepID=UPI0008B47371|nr:class I SAM-dependent methyltransferase [Roseateles sp. YR242]SEL22014.1 Methyltransferase domain-containing protein [Roseateles sp. YR242]